MRGCITKEINEIAKTRIGREIDTTELKLIPYIQYLMVNEQRIDIRRVNQDDREVLKKWKDDGFMEGGASSIQITKKFWDFMCEILFESYVKNTDGLLETVKKEVKNENI